MRTRVPSVGVFMQSDASHPPAESLHRRPLSSGRTGRRSWNLHKKNTLSRCPCTASRGGVTVLSHSGVAVSPEDSRLAARRGGGGSGVVLRSELL